MGQAKPGKAMTASPIVAAAAMITPNIVLKKRLIRVFPFKPTPLGDAETLPDQAAAGNATV